MSRYDMSDDVLCYPGTQVLKNKANLTDQDALDQFETLMFLTRSEEVLPSGKLDYAHYKAIHHHFFQDVYDWAGLPRQIRTAKNGNWFCYPEYIDVQMEKLFGQLAAESHLAGVDDPVDFAECASFYIAEINAIHPFRQGNGRCQLTLLSILFDVAGFNMNENLLNPAQVLEAMIASFSGETAPLAKAIRATLESDIGHSTYWGTEQKLP